METNQYKNIVPDEFFEEIVVEIFKDKETGRVRVRPVHPDLENLKIRFPKYLRVEHPIGARFKVDVKVSQKHTDGKPYGNLYLYSYENTIVLLG